ncbi:hypothetical protein ACROYT_G025660 [Oculina patagonica]
MPLMLPLVPLSQVHQGDERVADVLALCQERTSQESPSPHLNTKSRWVPPAEDGEYPSKFQCLYCLLYLSHSQRHQNTLTILVKTHLHYKTPMPLMLPLVPLSQVHQGDERVADVLALCQERTSQESPSPHLNTKSRWVPPAEDGEYPSKFQCLYCLLYLSHSQRHQNTLTILVI